MHTHTYTHTHMHAHMHPHPLQTPPDAHTYQFLLLDDHQKADNLAEFISLDVSDDVILDEVEERHAYCLAVLLGQTALLTGPAHTRHSR